MAEWRQVLKPPAGALPRDLVRTVGLCALTLVILGVLASSLWTGSRDDAGAVVPGSEPTLTGAGQVAQLTSRLTDLQDEQQRRRDRDAAAAPGLASVFGGPGTLAGDGDSPDAEVGVVGGTAPGALLTPDEIELRARLRLERVERRVRSLRTPAVVQTFRTPPVAGAPAPAPTGPPAAPAVPVAPATHAMQPPFDPGAVLSEITDAASAAAQAAGGQAAGGQAAGGQAERLPWERTVPGVTGPGVTGTAEAVTVTTPTDPPGWERVYEGSVVSAVLVTQLSGEFAGPVQAQVSIPFYSADRQRILVPRGARFLGTVQPVRDQDQRRLAVGFHRLVWPEGQWVDLAFHGLNAVGEGALVDQVNRHYVSMFAAAGAVGVLSGLTVPGATPYGGGREGFQAGVSQGLGQSASQMLDRFLNRLPAITIRAGHRLRIWLTADVLVPRPAAHPERMFR